MVLSAVTAVVGVFVDVQLTIIVSFLAVPSSPRRSILHTFESVEKASNKLNENVKVWENENGQDRREKYPELYAL